jgi:16S rRNA (guanine527-N7)-methyltransferase
MRSGDRRSLVSFKHIRGPKDFAAAFDVSRETLERIQIYERLLRQWQKAVNLVAPSTLDDLWHRHFADSAQILPLAGEHPTPWLDIGSGGGFPGLVCAILLADKPYASGAPPRVTLVESHVRKGAFLREVARQTGLAQVVDILSIRIETLPTQDNLPRPAVISARALAALDRLLALAAPLFGPSTVGLFPKGQGAEAEVAQAQSAWRFEADLVSSRTEPGGRIVVVRHLAPK